MRGRIADRLPHHERRILRLLELPVADEPQLVHAPQNVELAGARPFRIRDGIEGRRRLRQPGKHRGLGNVDLPERLAEIDLCRGSEAVGTLAQENLVDVQLEDLVLRQIGLDLVGEQHLAQLAGQCSFPGKKEIAGDLHGDRPRALLASARNVGQGRPKHGNVINAPMLVEPLVLGRQDRPAHDFGDFLDLYDRPALLAKLPEQLALGGQDSERDLRLVVGQGLQRGQSGIKKGKNERNQQGPDQRQAKQDGRQVDKPAL